MHLPKTQQNIGPPVIEQCTRGGALLTLGRLMRPDRATAPVSGCKKRVSANRLRRGPASRRITGSSWARASTLLSMDVPISVYFATAWTPPRSIGAAEQPGRSLRVQSSPRPLFSHVPRPVYCREPAAQLGASRDSAFCAGLQGVATAEADPPVLS